MAGSFRIAEGYVEVTADQAAYDAVMQRLKSSKNTVKVGVDLVDGGALAQLTRLAQNRTTKVNIDLAGMAAFAALDGKTRDRAVKVRIDLDTTTATTRLTELTKERIVKAKVDLDSASATTRLTELTKNRTVKVTISLDEAPLARLSDRSYTASFFAQINEPAYRKAEKLLDALTKDRVVQIRANVDTRVGAQELRNLVQRQRVQIGIDVDTRVAADDIANLTRRRTMDVTANANTAEARTRLDALARDRRMNINVGVNQSALSSLSSSLGSMFSGSGSGSSGIGSLIGSLINLKTAAVFASPAVLGFGQALVQMGPAAAVGIPAVLGLATAFAAIKIGTAGVGAAIKQSFAPVSAGASAALSAAKAIEAAQRSLAKAVQAEEDAEVAAAAARVAAARAVSDAQQNLKSTVSSVADANRLAAESVAVAERDLTSAQKAARQAQLDLTQARKDAAQQLQDLNNSLTDAHLTERQDVIALADAEAQLAKDKATGAIVSTQQLAKDQLARDQAAQALEEQKIQTQRLTDQTDKANKSGVEGSVTVVTAKQAAAAAAQTAADKARALNDAEIAANRTQVDGVQKIELAERNLADMRAAQVTTAVQGARQIANAEDAVTQAAEALGQAQQSAAIKTGGLANAMAKLAPNARGFVAALVGQKAAWTALKLDVQNRLFEGLGGSFTTMARSALPALHFGLVGMSGVLNSMAKNAMGAVTNLAKAGTLKAMFSGLTEGLKPLARIPGQFITALTQISVAASPAFKKLTTAAGSAVDGIMKKLDAAFKSGRLTEVIDQAIGMVKQLGQIIGNIFSIIGSLMSAANTSGGGFLNTLKTITGAIANAFKSDAVQSGLKALFQTMALIAKTAGPLLITALKTIAPVLTALAPPVQSLVKALGSALGPIITGLGPILVVAAKAFGQLLTGFQPLIAALPQLMKPISALVSALANAAPVVGLLLIAFNPFLGIMVLLAPVLAQLVKPIGQVVTGLTPLIASLGAFAGQLGQALVPIITALAPVVVMLARTIAQLFDALGPLLPIVGQMVAALGPVLTPVLEVIGMLFKALAPVISQLGKSLLPPFLAITQTLAGVFKNMAPILADALDLLGRKGLVPIVAALGVIIGKLVSSYANQFVSMFEMLLPIIPVLIPVVVQLAQSLSQILLAIAPLLPQMLLLGAQMITRLLPAILPLLQPLADLTNAFVWLATGVITDVVMPVLSGLIGFIADLQGMLQPGIDAVTWLTTAIHDSFQWLYDVLIGHSIIPDIVNGAIRWFTGLWTAAKRIFDGLKRDVESIWNGLWNGVRGAWNWFWGGMSSALGNARGWIANTFNGIRNTVSGTWSGLWNGVSSTFGTIIGTVNKKIGDFASGAKKVFTSLRDALGTIWDGVKDKFAAPIRFVIGTVYNHGIRSMWDTIADKVGLPQLPEIKLGFNTGGVVPGDGKGDIVPAMLTPGERILSLAQVARLGGHAAIDAMVGRNDNHGPHFGIGGVVSGIVSGIGGAISGGVDWVKNIVVGGLEAAARSAISAVVQPLINRIPTGGTAAGALIKGVPQTALTGILSSLGAKDKASAAAGGGQVNYTAGSGVAQWAPQILQALSLIGQPPSWLGTVERRMNQESGGNPNVVNRWDSNWTAGTPSVGLMQVIGPTYRSNAGPFQGTGPFSYGVSVDPLANTFAGLNYAMHRYGSLSALNRPGGYDQGGILAPGATMAVNRTGRPERVLNADQTAKVDAMLSHAGSGGGVTIEQVNISGTFDFSSPASRKQAANAMVVELKEALRDFDRARR